MRRSGTILAIGAALASATVSCKAFILVEYYKLDGTFLFDEGPYLNGNNVTVAINNSQVGIVRVFSDDGGNIGRITVSGSQTQTIWLVVATDMTLDDQFYTLPSSAAGQDWAGLQDNRTSGIEYVKAYFLGNLTNTVSADSLRSLQVEGAIQQAVTSNGGPCNIQAGSVTASGDITQATGAVGVVQTISGNLLGDVIAATNIGTVDVTGNIGSAAQVTTIQAQAGTIGSVFATGDIGVSSDSNKVLIKANPGTDVTGIDWIMGANIYSKITANMTAGKGRFRRLEATGANGAFMGKLTCTSLTGANGLVSIPGNFDGQIECSAGLGVDITIGGDFVGAGSGRWIKATQFTAGHTMSIGGKFTDGAAGEAAEINFSDTAGLDGQIIINADNGIYSPWTNAWTGDVIVHGVTVTPGDYTNTDLGDGGIGLARFTLHEQACTPADGDDLASLSGSITLVLYGPVILAPDYTTIPHVQVSRRQRGTNDNYVSVSTNFEVDTNLTAGRILAIKPKSGYSWGNNWDYRIRHDPPGGMGVPVYGYLKCDQVDTNPALLTGTESDGAYELKFSIQPL